MAGFQEAYVLVFNVDGLERLPSVSIAAEWMLTGDLKKEEAVCSSHPYESAPNIILFKILLCINVVAACSKLPNVPLKLLNQAQIMLFEICSKDWINLLGNQKANKAIMMEKNVYKVH